MEITTDVILRGQDWNTAISSLSPIFQTRTHYSLYILSASIGIMYDKQMELQSEPNEETRSVPRNVMQNDSESLDILFQAAILTTTTESLSEEERLDLAFSDNKTSFGKIALLTRFANYGVTKLVEKISSDSIETMENIKNFLTSSMEGTNFDIDAIADEDLDIEINL